MAKRAQGSALDCSRLRPCVFWFSIGLLLGLAVMRGQGAPTWASLLRVGSSNPLIGQIQRELGPVHPPDPVGHDGQLFFLIARDPVNAFGTAQRIAEFDNNPPRYRYRRILYPLLSGGFGQFNGRVTLAGMILLTAVGLGLTAVAIADLAHGLYLSGGVVFAGILNLGALISAMLLTADALALGLALGGLALVCRSRTGWAVTAFALAALTKEVYAIIPVSIGAFYIRERFLRRGLIVALVPLLPLLIWTAWVWMKIPDAPATATNLGIPFRGIIESVPSWRERYQGDLPQIAAAMFLACVFIMAPALVVFGRNRLLRSTVVPWLLVACVSTPLVWRLPTNAARAFAILWPLTWLMWVDRMGAARRSLHHTQAAHRPDR
jgi:hypothetical protein